MISRHPEGTVAIQDGTKFSTPVELIQYHTKKVDGLLTTLKRPCYRGPGQPPQGYRFITLEEMQIAMREAALQLGYQVIHFAIKRLVAQVGWLHKWVGCTSG